MTTLLNGQESVCELFKDLKAADGRQLILTGDLLISKDIAVLGAADCENQYISNHLLWPAALRLHASKAVPADLIKQLEEAAVEADRLRVAGKQVYASASFSGRLRVGKGDDLPAELAFDSFEKLRLEALPDARDLPVIPICELFQNLTAWKGKRIAVRGEISSTFEGLWIGGHCKGSFYTGKYRWPVALVYGTPAYLSRTTESITKVSVLPGPAKGEELLRGRHNVIKTATYVGRLRMRDEYMTGCRADGSYRGNGFGHLNYSAGQLIVEGSGTLN